MADLGKVPWYLQVRLDQDNSLLNPAYDRRVDLLC